jgi:hypothetical protein
MVGSAADGVAVGWPVSLHYGDCAVLLLQFPAAGDVLLAGLVFVDGWTPMMDLSAVAGGEHGDRLAAGLTGERATALLTGCSAGPRRDRRRGP